jgi:hypothetical protein
MSASFTASGKLVGMQIALRALAAVAAPVSTRAPAISGTARVGATLTRDTGAWSGTPTSFTTAWQRCTAAGTDCVSIAGATGGSYVVQPADAGSTLRVAVVARNAGGTGSATSAATAPVPGGSAPLLRDTFDAPNGQNNLITNEYAFWNAPQGVQSAVWEMDSGSAFSIAPPAGVGASGNVGWTGVPDTCGSVDVASRQCTNSNVFRLDSRRRDFGNVSLSIDAYNRGYTVSSPDDWDGIELWLRYQDEYHLYLVKPERHDGHVTIQKKCPGGPSNSGTYSMLFEQSGHPFSFNAWLHLSASAKTNADGSVTLTVSRDGRQIGQAVDAGGSDIYGEPESCGPITNAGGIGIRGDNDDFYFDNLQVDPLS